MAIFVSLDRVLLIAFLALLAWSAISDGIRFRIPNLASLGIALLYPAHVVASVAPVDWIGAVIVAAILFLIGFCLFVRGFVGGGDAKLLAASALWAGPHLLPAFLLVTTMTGGFLALAAWLLLYLRRMRAAGTWGLLVSEDSGIAARRIPYGIAIAAGAACVGIQLLLS